MTAAQDFWRRRLVTVAARDYGDDDFARRIDEQVAVLTGWLTDPQLCGREFVHEALNPTQREDVRIFVANAVNGTDDDDVLVVYVTGHGIGGESRCHYLVLPESDEENLLGTCYRTSDLLSAVLSSDAGHVLVIVDSCHAGALDAEWAYLSKDLPKSRRELKTLTVISSAQFDEKPRVGEFAELLMLVHQRLQPRGPAEIISEYLTVAELFTEIDAVLRENSGLKEPIQIWPRRTVTGQASPCLPNPGYSPPVEVVYPAVQQVAYSHSQLDDYWILRASGRIAEGDPGWYFSGRADIMRAVVEFLLSGEGIQVVTGVAGSGKSAVLARAVTLSDGRFRNDNPELLAGIGSSLLPPEGCVDAALLAREKDAIEICAELLQLLGGRSSGGASSVEQLIDHLGNIGRVVTIVVDGVDEAIRPDVVITDLLVPMSKIVDGDGTPQVRLLLGLRSERGADSLLDDRGVGLLELMRRNADEMPITVVRTDEAPTVTADVAAYLVALLDVEGPYAGAVTADDPVIRIVAEKVSPSFLDARLAGDRLRSANQRQDPRDPAWLYTLADGTLSLFRADLTETAAEIGWPSWQVLAVLRATAFAVGRGLPWGDVWPTAAQAVCDQPFENPVDNVIEAVLGSRLAGYLAYDVEDDRVVRRPNHARLAEELRENAEALIDDGDPWVVDGSIAVHRRIATALAALVNPVGAIPPHPYVARHLTDHAYRGGVLDDSHVPAAVLPWHPGRIRGLLGIPPPPGSSAGRLAAWARIEPFLGDADVPSRRMSLAFACASVGLPLPGADDEDAPLALSWMRWSLPPGNILAVKAHGGHMGSVDALVWMHLPIGPGSDRPGKQLMRSAAIRILLASGGRDGMVRLWDRRFATVVGNPLDGHGGQPVEALATVTLPDERVFLASGGRDGTIRLWDPLRFAAIGEPLDDERGRGAITALAEVRLPEQPVMLSSGSEDGTVRLWELPIEGGGRTSLSDLMVGFHSGGVKALAVLPIPGGPVLLASGGGDGTVRLWDPLTATAVEIFDASYGSDDVSSLAAMDKLYVAAGDSVWVWNPLTRTHSGVLGTHDGSVWSLTGIRTPSGIRDRRRPNLASGDDRGVILLWNSFTRTPAGELHGHDGPVCSLAAEQGLPGLTMPLASGGMDGTIRLWNTDTDIQDSQSDQYDGVPVLSLAELRSPDAPLLMASGGRGGVVRLWDPLTGTPAGELTGHRGPVNALTQLRSLDGSVLLAASGGADYSIWLWDPLTQAPVVESLQAGHGGRVTALAEVQLPDGSVRLASGSSDGKLLLTTGGQDNTLRSLEKWSGRAHMGPVLALAELRLPDGTMLASGGSDGVVLLWNPGTAEFIGALRPTDPKSAVHSMAPLYTEDGTVLIATGRSDGVVQLRDPLTSALVRQMSFTDAEPVTALAEMRSPKGAVLLAGGSQQGDVRLWDSTDGTEIARISTGTRINALRFISDGDQSLLVIGGDGGIACLSVRLLRQEKQSHTLG